MKTLLMSSSVTSAADGHALHVSSLGNARLPLAVYSHSAVMNVEFDLNKHLKNKIKKALI